MPPLVLLLSLALCIAGLLTLLVPAYLSSDTIADLHSARLCGTSSSKTVEDPIRLEPD